MKAKKLTGAASLESVSILLNESEHSGYLELLIIKNSSAYPKMSEKAGTSICQLSGKKDIDVSNPRDPDETSLPIPNHLMKELKAKKVKIRHSFIMVSCFINHLIILRLNSSLRVI